VDAGLRTLVRKRAEQRCEYYRLPQLAASFFAFHIEHIVARQHGGDDNSENLALACPDCNRYKGPNLTSIDPQTNEIVRLFDPRKNNWEEQFELQGPLIVGCTPTGRATVRLLNMNEHDRLDMRSELIEDELYP